MYKLYNARAEEALKSLPDCSVDSVITDPPYEIGFMGKSWDNTGIAYNVGMWAEVLRVLKPGGYLLSFGSARTYHRIACAIEDAGFEIRDQIMWVYGSGFPKSMDVSKAIDKAAGVDRKVIGSRDVGPDMRGGNFENSVGRMIANITEATTEAALDWEGWGTALKPAHEPICVARKPLIGTVAQNVLAHGTGAINIDGCRVAADDGEDRSRPPRTANKILGGDKGTNLTASEHNALGRWPANLIHDGSAEVTTLFPTTSSGVMKAGTTRAAQDQPGSVCYGTYGGNATGADTYGDTGSAARFFYCAKASKKDRGDGNDHPTVKPTALMRYLVRLVTRTGGVVLDPFTGSGSTGKAAMLEGFNFIGIDEKPEYVEIAQQRIKHAAVQAFDAQLAELEPL